SGSFAAAAAAGVGGGSSAARSACRSAFVSRALSRRWRHSDGTAASRPSTTPAIRKTSRKTTSGACHDSWPTRTRRSTLLVFDSANPSAATNSARLNSHVRKRIEGPWTPRRCDDRYSDGGGAGGVSAVWPTHREG